MPLCMVKHSNSFYSMVGLDRMSDNSSSIVCIHILYSVCTYIRRYNIEGLNTLCIVCTYVHVYCLCVL